MGADVTSCFCPDCLGPVAWEVTAPRVELRLACCSRHLHRACQHLMIHTHPQQGRRVTVSPHRKVKG